MRIAVNTRFLISGKLEGIGIYTQEIFKRVVQLLPEHEFYFLFDRPYSKEYLFAENITPIVVSPPARHPFLWYWWFEKSIPSVLKENNIDLLISPDGFCSLKTEIPQIMTIHDLGFEHFKNHTPFLVAQYYRYFTPKYCRKATKILAVSEFTKKDIVSKYNIEEQKIELIYNGFENRGQSTVDSRQKDNLRAYGLLNDPYFLFIGAVHPRKNILSLLKAFELLKLKHKLSHQLVIVGRKAWMNDALENYFQQMKFKNDVVWIDKIERNNLLQILQNAFALVYPSLFEGFGIPVLEAMSLGVPVITSNTSAMPEIAGNAAVLVNPNTVDDIAAAMHTMTLDTGLRNELIQKGYLRSKAFDWNLSAQKVANLIRTFEK